MVCTLAKKPLQGRPTSVPIGGSTNRTIALLTILAACACQSESRVAFSPEESKNCIVTMDNNIVGKDTPLGHALIAYERSGICKEDIIFLTQIPCTVGDSAKVNFTLVVDGNSIPIEQTGGSNLFDWYVRYDQAKGIKNGKKIAFYVNLDSYHVPNGFAMYTESSDNISRFDNFFNPPLGP